MSGNNYYKWNGFTDKPNEEYEFVWFNHWNFRNSFIVFGLLMQNTEYRVLNNHNKHLWYLLLKNSLFCTITSVKYNLATSCYIRAITSVGVYTLDWRVTKNKQTNKRNKIATQSKIPRISKTKLKKKRIHTQQPWRWPSKTAFGTIYLFIGQIYILYTHAHTHKHIEHKMENVVLLVLSTFIFVELQNNLWLNHWTNACISTHTHTPSTR